MYRFLTPNWQWTCSEVRGCAAALCAGPELQPASKHHFLVVDLLDGEVHCAADVWVQVTEHTSFDTEQAGSCDQLALAQNQAAAKQDNFNGAVAGNGSSRCDGRSIEQSLAPALDTVQQVASSSVQLVLDRQQQVVDGYAAHVADVFEVFRTIDDSSVLEQQQSQGNRCVEYWDAFSIQWKKAWLPPLAAPAGVMVGAHAAH